MKHFLPLFVSILLTACGPTYVGPQDLGEEEKDAPKTSSSKKESEEESQDDEEPVVKKKTTITIEEEEVAKKKRGPHIVAKYELVNDNEANEEFIGANYCLGSALRDCWIRSGYLTEWSDGSYDVAIEFWDTYDQVPYTVSEDTIEAEKAFLLTDKAKLITDKTFAYKMLWAVVVPEDKTLGVIYDWAGDGPGRQGDDLVDSFEFQKIEDSEED